MQTVPVRARLAYIDWMRGLACVLMFQTHCYDSWLSPAARKTTFFMYSQLLGTLPAPLFLFLAGISFALVTDKLRKKDVAAGEIAKTTVLRGAEIVGFGLLFRLQLFLFNWRWAPWTDLLRVDILNTIGVSMMLMGGVCWAAAVLSTRGQAKVSLRAVAVAGAHAVAVDPTPSASGGQIRRLRGWTIAAALATAVVISLLTPPLWTTHRLRFLPWPLESYINGVHTFAAPKGWFFPIFPWAGFAFAGLAIGFLLWSDFGKRNEAAVFASLGASGVVFIEVSRWLEHQAWQFYSVYSYWTTSPEFFLLRVGLLLVILFAVYAWCRWGVAQYGWSALIQLGQTSLMVYWVHIEFVYDRFMILPSHGNSVRVASFGLAFITAFMIVLSMIRTRAKGRGTELAARVRAMMRPAVSEQL